MAAPCPDARPCCAAVYVAFVPQASASVPQMLWTSQTPTIPGAAWNEWNGADASLGLGAPLQGGAFWHQPEQLFEQTPAQCFMGCGESALWNAPSQFVMNAAAPAPSEVHGSAGWHSRRDHSFAGGPGIETTDIAATSQAPSQDHMGTEPSGSQDNAAPHLCNGDATPTSVLARSAVAGAAIGLGKSELRRRRRQRAAMASPAFTADDGIEEESSTKIRGRVVEEHDASRLARMLLEEARHGNASHCAARFRRLAFADKNSSRAAQLALEEGGPVAVALVAGMHWHVRSAMRSMFANYTLQKIVEVMPWSSAKFIPQELLGAGGEVARHRFGCRILCRLLEHGPLSEPSLAALIEELLADAAALSCHEFGNYVVRHSLEFGLPEHRRWVAQALCCVELPRIACHQYGSRVVETALQFCGPDEQRMLACELLRDGEQLVNLATNVAGRHVVKALVNTTGGYRARIEELLVPAKKQLREAKYGNLVLEIIRGKPM